MAPKKPTQPFGHIEFSKDGKVTKRISELSPNKEVQESQALERFIAGFNKATADMQITDYQQLSEDNQDFILILNGVQEVEAQLTELVDYHFASPMSEEEHIAGNWSQSIQKEFGKPAWRIDVDKKDAALVETIRNKVNKRYARTAETPLWLIIFTTLDSYMSSNIGRVVNVDAAKHSYVHAGTCRLRHLRHSTRYGSLICSNDQSGYGRLVPRGVVNQLCRKADLHLDSHPSFWNL